jgi:4-hydroxybutyrate CoA-transferase
MAMKRWIEVDEVARVFEPGMTVFVAGATAEPGEILDALRRQGDSCAGVHFVSVSIPGINGVDFSTLHPEARSTAFFATPENRASIESGRVEFIPMQYSAIFDYLKNDLKVDVVLAQLPEAQGDTVSLGLSADFLPAVLDKAGLVIAEVNKRQPSPPDSVNWPVDRIDLAISCDRPVAAFPLQQADEVSRVVGEHVAELISDGDCIQIGIGTISGAILDVLANKNDLGVHSGLITDGVMKLADAGNTRGKIVTGTTLGSETLIEWAGSAPDLMIRPVGYTHDPGIIRQIDNFVSLNSAIEIDLFGQVSADMLDGRQWTGPGGAVDMMRGAALSKGGRSVVALKSTTGKRKQSRIVPALERCNAATALRTDIDYVVTEHGARCVRNLSVQARAEALIEIAASEFRDQLRDEWLALSN